MYILNGLKFEYMIIKDIRYYEDKPSDYHGKFDGTLGNVYQNSLDTKYIGQRISRKLNELKLSGGEFDHIYICFSSKINENEIEEDNRFLDKRIRLFKYGIKPSQFNILTDTEKDLKVNRMTFEVLNFLFKDDEFKMQIINEAKEQVDRYGKLLVINYKVKETSGYRINLSFQIRPYDDTSKLITTYLNKKEASEFYNISDLCDYEDLYSLIDTVTVKQDSIIFQPKKSYRAEIVSKRYKDPITQIEIGAMIKKE